MKNFRIKYCKEAERNVLQIQCADDNEWICLHCDTLEEEQQDMLEFIENNPDATLQGKQGILIRDLELVQGHLINSEKRNRHLPMAYTTRRQTSPSTHHFPLFMPYQKEKEMLNDSTISD